MFPTRELHAKRRPRFHDWASAKDDDTEAAKGKACVVKVVMTGSADDGENRQMISVGNISKQDCVALFMMDYPQRERVKILGQAKVFDAREHPELVEKVLPPGGHGAKVERVVIIDILSYDWNCPKFITPRYTAVEIQQAAAPLRQRIAELETKLKALGQEP